MNKNKYCVTKKVGEFVYEKHFKTKKEAKEFFNRYVLNKNIIYMYINELKPYKKLRGVQQSHGLCFYKNTKEDA